MRLVIVLFRPEEATPWEHHNTIGMDAPTIEFTGGEPYRLQVELFFDRYEEKQSVRELTDKIEKLALADPPLHEPPKCFFRWDSLEFKCVLEEFKTRYTLFLDDGTPVRAVMNVVFKEFAMIDAQNDAVYREVQNNAGDAAPCDETRDACPQRIFAVLPTSAQPFLPIAIGGTNFNQGAIPYVSNAPSITIIGFNTQNLPLIGSVSVGFTILPPAAPRGPGDVKVDYLGQMSNPFPFTVR